MLPYALTVEAWWPVTAPLTNGSDNRSAEAYVKVIDQFQVEKNPRYKPLIEVPNNLKTFCNIFCWDCTRALGCEIPHWWLNSELTANEMISWLDGRGELHGWKKATKEEARVSALAGRPTVAAWKNPKRSAPGHMAMVLPDSKEIIIAQAGKDNFARARLSVGFGDFSVSFWVHA
jgi:hypothetical protein